MGNIFWSRPRSRPQRENLDDVIIKSILQSLNEIQTLMNEMNANRSILLSNFEEWVRARRRTLSAIQNCQDELDTIHSRSSLGQVVGSGAEILGALATAVGFGMSFFPDLKSIADELMKYGPAVGVMGCAAETTAFLAGKGFSAYALRKLKQALEEDQRLTAELLPWLRRAAKLEKLLQEVFGCSVVRGIKDIFTYLGKICVLLKEGTKTISDTSDILFELLQNFSITDLQKFNLELEAVLSHASSKVKTLLLGFCQSSEVQNAVRALYSTFIKSPDLFEIPKVSSCIVTEITEQENALCSEISLTGGTPFNWSNGVVRGIIVLAKIRSFLFTVEDLKEGKSEYSELITQTKHCLSLELEILTSFLFLSRKNA